MTTPTGDPRARIHQPRVGIVEQPQLTGSGITRGGAEASRGNLAAQGSKLGRSYPEGCSHLGSPQRPVTPEFLEQLWQSGQVQAVFVVSEIE